MKNPKVYSLFPHFICRRPWLSLKFFDQISSKHTTDEDLLQIYESSKLIKRAITVAAPKVAQSLDLFYSLKKEKQRRNLIETLYTYLLRMSTRSTPFGLFSTVSNGLWGGELDNENSMDEFVHTFYPDAVWLWKIREKLHQNPQVLSNLSISKNPFLVDEGPYYTLSHSVLENTHETRSNLKKSPFLENLLAIVGTCTQVKKAYETLRQKYPELSCEQFLQIIQRLLDKQILISNLPSSLQDDIALNSLICFLKKKEDFDCKPLEKIQHLFKKLNTSSFDWEINLFKQVDEEMQNLQPIEHSTYSTLVSKKTQMLPLSLKSQIETGLDLLIRLFDSIPSTPHLDVYYSKFMNAYGVSTAIPFLEVVNPTRGIGLPHQNQSSSLEHTEDEFLLYLKDKCLQATINGEHTVELKDNELGNFQHDKDGSSFPESLDLYCEIYPDALEGEKANDPLIVFYPISGVLPGFASSGRFIQKLEMTSIVQGFREQENEIQRQIEPFEVDFWPSKMRAANVCRRPVFKESLLNLSVSSSGKDSFSLQEIYVFASQTHLHLCDKNGKVLRLNNLTLINPDLIPKYLKLLFDISNHGTQTLDTHLWSLKGHLPYLPRIAYENIVLSLAQWSLDKATLKHLLDKPSALAKSIKEWTHRMKIPNLVRITDGGDKKLLIKLDHERSFELLLRLISKKTTEKVFFIEVPKNQPFSESDIVSEYIFTAVKNKAHTRKPIAAPLRIQKASSHSINTNDWLFFSVYMPEEYENLFLVNHLIHVLQKFENSFSKWFFIRYTDSVGKHLRLRFKAKASEKGCLFEEITNWLNDLNQIKLVTKFTLEPYQREIERYGGEEVIDAAEDVFCADSNLVLEQLKLKESDSDRLLRSIENYVHYTKSFGMNENETLDFLNEIQIDRKHLNGFREIKRELEKRVEQGLSNSLTGLNEELRSAYILRERSCLQYLEQLQNRCPITYVLPSFLHMFSNRYIGRDHDQEFKCYAYLKNSIQNLRFKTVIL